MATLLELALVVAIAQILACLLARGFSTRLPCIVAALGVTAPLCILLPLLAGHRLVVPTDATILNNLPDAPRVDDPDLAHGIFNDAILQLLPWEAEVRRGFAEGHLPLWSDLLDGGSSPWVNPQAGVLSPIALPARILPLQHFILGTLLVKMLLACSGLWLLARALGASRWAAALAGAAFAWGGPIVAWSVFPLSSAVAWSPWLLLGALRLARHPSIRHTVCTALVLAAVLLSGHPEIALAECLLAAGFGLVVAPGRRPARRWKASLRHAALAAILGAGLASCVLVPVGMVAPRSLRASQPTKPAGDAPPRLFDAGHGELLLSALNPWAFGRPFHEPFRGPGNWPIAAGSYLGLTALAGIAASFTSRRRRLVLSLFSVSLGLSLLAAGFYPLKEFFLLLPLGGALAFDRFLPAAALPLALLAALGLDELMKRDRSRASLLAVILASAASLALRCEPWIVALWIALALALGLRRGRRPIAFGCLTLVTLIDLGAWDRDALPRGHRELFYPRTPLIDEIAGATADAGAWRAVAGGFALYPSLLPMYGIADVRIDNPIAPTDTLEPLISVFDFRPEGRRYQSAFQHLDHPFLDFLNVRAVVLAATASPPARFRELPSGAGPLRVYQNMGALPRFFLPTSAIVHERSDVLAALRTLHDPRSVILVRDEVSAWRPPERTWEPAAVTVRAARRGRVQLHVAASGDRLLATSLPFPTGWTARADGRGLRRLTVNSAYFGTVIPDGVTSVELDFEPPGFRIGTVISLASALALLLLVAAPRLAPLYYKKDGKPWLHK